MELNELVQQSIQEYSQGSKLVDSNRVIDTLLDIQQAALRFTRENRQAKTRRHGFDLSEFSQ